MLSHTVRYPAIKARGSDYTQRVPSFEAAATARAIPPSFDRVSETAPYPAIRTLTAPAVEAAIEPPDWFQDIRRKYTLRVQDWVTQAWAVTVAPRRFMEEWATGQRETLNPLRFFAFGTAVAFLVDRVGRWLLHIPAAPNTGVLGWLNSSGGATVWAFLNAALMHLVLRIRSRAPLRSSVAATAFSSAGPGTLFTVAGWLISGVVYLLRRHVPSVDCGGTIYPTPVLVLSALFFLWTMPTLAGAHRVRWWWGLLAFLALPVAIAVVTVVAALVIATTKFGLADTIHRVMRLAGV